MIVPHVVDGAGRYNDKAEDAPPMRCLSTHTPSSALGCSSGKYMFVGPNSVFRNAGIQLAPSLWL